jgi:voltage-gated sodium channel
LLACLPACLRGTREGSKGGEALLQSGEAFLKLSRAGMIAEEPEIVGFTVKPQPPPELTLSPQVEDSAHAAEEQYKTQRTDMETMMLTYGYALEAVDEDELMKRQRREIKARNSTNACWLCFFKISVSMKFQLFYSFLIVINSITMWVEVDFLTRDEDRDILEWCEFSFTILFLLEVIIRLIGSPSIAKDKVLWLDCFIVLVTVVDNFVLRFFEVQYDLSVIMILRVLRLLRVMRIFRAAGYFRPVRVIISAMASATFSLFWIALLLVVIFYVFGLTFRMLLDGYEKDQHIGEVREKYFYSVFGTMLTLLEVLVRGFSWTEEITMPMVKRGNLFVAGLWLFFVIFCHVCLANLLIGVFVEQMLSTARESDERVEREQLFSTKGNLKELRKIFRKLDEEDKGRLTSEQFVRGMQKYPEAATLFDIKIEEASIVFDALDMQGRGSIDLDDFLFGIVKVLCGTKSVDTLSFDYQLKQIARMVQKAPKQMDALGRKLAGFEKKLKRLASEAHVVDNGGESEHLANRLTRLEQRMTDFLTNLQITRAPAGSGGVAASAPGQAVSLANMRGSYSLAFEMQELRKVMQAVRPPGSSRLRAIAAPQIAPPVVNRAAPAESSSTPMRTVFEQVSIAEGRHHGGVPAAEENATAAGGLFGGLLTSAALVKSAR